METYCQSSAWCSFPCQGAQVNWKKADKFPIRWSLETGFTVINNVLIATMAQSWATIQMQRLPLIMTAQLRLAWPLQDKNCRRERLCTITNASAFVVLLWGPKTLNPLYLSRQEMQHDIRNISEVVDFLNYDLYFLSSVPLSYRHYLRLILARWGRDEMAAILQTLVKMKICM